MSVLKPIKDNGTVQISVKIPTELRDRANSVKDKLKAKGFTIDIAEAAVSGIKRLVKTAEKELKDLVLEHSNRSRTADTAEASKREAQTSKGSTKAASA